MRYFRRDTALTIIGSSQAPRLAICLQARIGSEQSRGNEASDGGRNRASTPGSVSPSRSATQISGVNDRRRQSRSAAAVGVRGSPAITFAYHQVRKGFYDAGERPVGAGEHRGCRTATTRRVVSIRSPFLFGFEACSDRSETLDDENGIVDVAAAIPPLYF